jgi:precorrin-6A/cobalt-precorrin-6A reductase
MQTFLQEQKPELVLDATHPYATVVTQTLQQACQQEQVEYQRMVRPQGQYAHCIMVDSFAEAVEVLSQTTGTIFLTTGSKNLPDFTHLYLILGERSGGTDPAHAGVFGESSGTGV